MRGFLALFISFVVVTAGAQTIQTSGAPDYLNQDIPGKKHINTEDHLSARKWYVSRYSTLTTGFTFFNGGSANYISAPIGLQLNRRLNSNWYAFAGVSAAPTYMHFNRSFQSFAGTKPAINNGLFKTNNYGLYSRAELGLMYINEDKTFSISGSIGVQRSSNPVFFVQPVTSTPLLLPAHPIN